MNEEIKALNKELKQLKDTLTTFTNETEQKINHLLNKIEATNNTCDKSLQKIIDTVKDLYEEPSPIMIDRLLFDLILAFFNVYGLETEEEIFDLYKNAIDTTYDDDFDFLEFFENDPTEFNLMLLLKAYCKYTFFGTDFNFSKKIMSAVNYNNAMKTIFKLKENGFKYSQFFLIKKDKTFSRVSELCSADYYDLLMIKDLTIEQIKFLKDEKEMFDYFLLLEGIEDQCIVGI